MKESPKATDEQIREVERLLAFGVGRPSSPFEVLGIPKDEVLTVSTTEITKRFRQLSLSLHPDKCPHAEAGTAFSILEKSYNALKQEPVLLQLQRAEGKRQMEERQKKEKDEEQKMRKEMEKEKVLGQKRAREEGAGSSFLSLGQRCCLSATGVSSDQQKESEIKRILCCTATSYFEILDVDPESDFDVERQVLSSSTTKVEKDRSEADKTVTREEVRSTSSSTTVDGSEKIIRKKYRRIAQALHPDKCTLPGTVDAFQRVEKAHLELVDPKKFIRYKAAYQQAKKKEELLRRSNGFGMSGRLGTGMAFMEGIGGGGEEGDSLEARRAADLREHALKAARLAEEIAEKKKRVEEIAAEEASLGAMLERQRKGWKDMMML